MQLLVALFSFVLGLSAGAVVWWWKARGIRLMLADEVALNLQAYNDFRKGDPWPVRSVYIWQSLQTLVPGFMYPREVKALAGFYYLQAVVYKEREQKSPLTVENAQKLRDAARETLKALGRSV